VGRIDELAVFNRALSAEAIDQLYLGVPQPGHWGNPATNRFRPWDIGLQRVRRRLKARSSRGELTGGAVRMSQSVCILCSNRRKVFYVLYV